MELTKEEQLAITLVQSNPEVLHFLTKNGAIQRVDLHNFFHALSRSLYFSEEVRRKNYIDVEIVSDNNGAVAE